MVLFILLVVTLFDTVIGVLIVPGRACGILESYKHVENWPRDLEANSLEPCTIIPKEHEREWQMYLASKPCKYEPVYKPCNLKDHDSKRFSTLSKATVVCFNTFLSFNQAWSNYGPSTCSASCGGGNLFRTRVCVASGIQVENGNCTGRSNVTIPCNTHPCEPGKIRPDNSNRVFAKG